MANLADIAYLQWLELDDKAQQDWYTIYRDYYNGVQGVPLDDRQKKYLAQQMTAINAISGTNVVTQDDGFSFNYMALPVNVLVQRLIVDGFTTSDITEGEPSEDSQSATFQEWWDKNRMDSLSIGTHRVATIDGDTYILVSWDDDNKHPVFTHEQAWAPFRDAQGTLQDAEGMKVVYKSEGKREIEFAVKRWREIDVNDKTAVSWRLNLYLPDRIEKFKQEGDIVMGDYLLGWGQPFEIVEWTDSNNDPLGVPVIPFRHDDDGSNYGRSKLDDLISVQNAINKTILDLMTTSDKTAFPIITLEGGDPKDQDGNAIDVEPGAILSHPNAQARWGQFSSGDLSQLISLKNELIFANGQISQTPISYFQITGQVSSAEGQKAGEANLIANAELTAVSFGNSWEDVMAFGRKLANEFDNADMDIDISISARWQPFERIDVVASEQTKATTNATMFGIFQTAEADGFDTEQAALIAGYPPQRAKAMAESKENQLIGITQTGTSTASNLVTDKGLTGVAGQTVIETLQALAADEITRTTAIEIIVGFGFAREVAEQLADAEIDNAEAARVARLASGTEDVDITVSQ